MELFPWNDNFLTGQKEVDEQHSYWISLINKFIGSIAVNKVSMRDVNEVYSALKSYTIYHFEEEEQLMKTVGIAPEFLEEHIEAHHSFLDQLNQVNEQISEDNLDGCRHLSDLLVHWLVVHILIKDKNMGRQIIKIESGMSAKEAYDTEMESEDCSIETLINALNHLFSEIAKRNQDLVVLNQTLEYKVAERTSDLQKLNEELKYLSITDQLTSLPNRRFAISHLNTLWADSDKNGVPLSCLMIDVDNFKIVNDSYGHDAGDKVLIELTQQLKQTLRNDDIVCRLGGDEFFVICENTSLSGAQHAAQLLSDAVSELTVSVGDGQWLGSVSIGVACKLDSMQKIDQLMKMADQGVYLAKQAGKGCVKTF